MVYDVVSAKFYIADIKLTVCLNAVGDCDYTETVLSMIILPKPPVEELNNGNKYFCPVSMNQDFKVYWYTFVFFGFFLIFKKNNNFLDFLIAFLGYKAPLK